MKRNWWAVGVCALVLAMGLGSPIRALEYSGAFYVGDGNGNGIIEPGDISRAQGQYATGAADYSAVTPPAWDVVELNGNGVIDPPDISILQQWFVGNFATGAAGKPAALVSPGPTVLGLFEGESVVICDDLTDQAGVGDPNTTERAGWGVTFKVDQTPGLCATALIYGRNPWPTVDEEYGYYSKAFEYTDRMPPFGHGRACVRVLAPPSGCNGLNIVVHSYLPGDSEALCNGLPNPCYGATGRFPTQLDGPTFTSNITEPPLLTVSPDPAALNDGNSVQLTATDSQDGDVTQNANTTWSVTAGPCAVNNVAPNKGRVSVAEGCADDSCAIEAVYNPGTSRSDTGTVTVADNEAGAYNALTATVCGDINDGDPINCATPDRLSSDGCNRGPASCSWSCAGDCAELCMPTTTGSYTGRCQDGAVFAEDTATVTNNETALTTMTVTPAGPVNLNVGGSQDFYAMGTFSDGCTLNEDATASWSKTGDCAASNVGTTGLYTAPGSGGACTDVVTATQSSVSDSSTVIIAPAPSADYFPIATTPQPEGALSAAFDGTNFLVGINGDTTSFYTINAQLVSPEGDRVGGLISLAPTGSMPFIAFDGTNYLALFEDRSAETIVSLKARLVSAGGVAGAISDIISDDNVDMYGLTYGGGKYLVTYLINDPDHDGSALLYGKMITTAGVVGSQFPVTGDTVWSGGSDSGMHSAFDGTNFMVVWVPKYQADNFDPKTVEGRFFNTSGVPQGSDFQINASPDMNDNPFAVAYGGGQYLVVWDDQVGGYPDGDWDLKAQLVTTAGALSGSVINIKTGPGHAILPLIVFDGVNFLVSYTDLSHDADRDFMCDPWLEEGTCLNIFGRFITPAGVRLGDQFPLYAANGNDMGGAAAFGDGKYLVLNNQGLSNDPFRGDLTGGDVFGRFLTPAPASEANPPTTPANLTAVKGDGAVNLSWTASTDDTAVAGYMVFFCSGETVDWVTTTAFSHPSRFINKSLCYYVKAFDWNGNFSAASNQVNETPQLALKLESDDRNTAIMGALGANTVEAGEPILVFASNALPSPSIVAVEFRNLPAGSWLPATSVHPAAFIISCTVPSGLTAGSAEMRVTMDARVSNSYPVTVVPGTWTPGAYSISGLVTDGVDPVDGALVLALAQDTSREGGVYTTAAVSNGSGGYALNLDAGLYGLLTLKEGGNLQESEIRLAVSGSATQDIVLDPGLVYSGWVVNSLDSTIKPGGGYIQLMDANGDDTSGSALVYADGSFRIVTGPGARYTEVELSNQLLYPNSISPISGGTVEADRTGQLVPVTRGAPFEIWAGDTADPPAPVSGINLGIYYYGSGHDNRVITDASGFALAPTFGGTVEIKAEPQSYDTDPYVGGRIRDFTMPANGMNFGVLTMYRGYRVTGQVVAGDTTGPFYAISLLGSNDSPPPESPFSELFSDWTTNDMGEFVGRVYPGSNHIQLRFEDYNNDHGTTYMRINENRTINADTDLGTYTAYQGVGITGNVVDDLGQPVSDVDVQCQNSSPSYTGDTWLDYPDSIFRVLVYPDSDITCWVWDNWSGGYQTFFPGNPISCPGPVPMNCDQGAITLDYRPGAVCGDFNCDVGWGEDGSWCSDCIGYCGDWFCDYTEDEFSCPSDCGSTPYCGDFNCDVGWGEDGSWCSDCAAYCGDFYCDAINGEHSGNCGGDCWCGDGTCDFWEFFYNTCPGMDGCP